VNVAAQVALGRITFGMVNADELFQARAHGIPLVAVMTTFQVNPQCLMWHANDTSIKTLADLSNHTIIYSFGVGYWDYMKNKYHYKNIKEVNYDFTLRTFLATPNAVNQGYITSEPYTAIHSGHPVKALLIASTGYDPYADVMVTTESEIKNHPDVVRAYVQASVAGWKAYYDPANTERINALLRADPTAKNFPYTPAAMDYDEAHSMPLVTGDEAKTHGIGYIDPVRMTLLKKQLISVGIKVRSVDPASTFTNRFLPGM
jgi:NitT/TauT family transport system substrate-binding protein